MNDRIRQLAEQAGMGYGNLTTGNGDNWIVAGKPEELERFAELIVRECIDVVKPTPDHEVWAQSYLGGVNGLELLEDKITKIKQHFGVEE